MNKSNVHIYTFCKYLSFVSGCVFSVSNLNVVYKKVLLIKKTCKIADFKEGEIINTKMFVVYSFTYLSVISC